MVKHFNIKFAVDKRRRTSPVLTAPKASGILAGAKFHVEMIDIAGCEAPKPPNKRGVFIREEIHTWIVGIGIEDLLQRAVGVLNRCFLARIDEVGLWVVDCTHVGQGQPALKYLSRYLYRGVISEKNIVANQHGKVTFKYLDSKTGQTRYRTLKGEDFLWLVLQHVLPKGFRRVRDYGFLHGNARKLLTLIQLTLKVVITIRPARPRPVFSCPRCQSPMQILAFIRPAWPSG
jgi:hypothetical protein